MLDDLVFDIPTTTNGFRLRLMREITQYVRDAPSPVQTRLPSFPMPGVEFVAVALVYKSVIEGAREYDPTYHEEMCLVLVGLTPDNGGRINARARGSQMSTPVDNPVEIVEFKVMPIEPFSTRVAVRFLLASEPITAWFYGLLLDMSAVWPTLKHTAGEFLNGMGVLYESLLPEPTDNGNDIRDASSTLPWDVVPNGQYREIVRLWWSGGTYNEIGDRVGLTGHRIGNLLVDLRKAYGEDVIPYKRDLKRMGYSG